MIVYKSICFFPFVFGGCSRSFYGHFQFGQFILPHLSSQPKSWNEMSCSLWLISAHDSRLERSQMSWPGSLTFMFCSRSINRSQIAVSHFVTCGQPYMSLLQLKRTEFTQSAHITDGFI